MQTRGVSSWSKLSPWDLDLLVPGTLESSSSPLQVLSILASWPPAQVACGTYVFFIILWPHQPWHIAYILTYSMPNTYLLYKLPLYLQH